MSSLSQKSRARTHSRSASAASATSVATIWLHRIMESLWLLTAGLVPLLFAPPDFMLFLDLPKIALLRVLTGLMALLWVVEWALGTGKRGLGSGDSLASGPQPLASNLQRWAILAATLFLFANVISALLSPSISVSVWGANPGRDGYGLYNMVSYYLLFMVVATHLKTRKQLWRLLIVIAAAAALASLYGLLQHHLIDPLLGPPQQSRITATFGNALFAASFLVMTIPLTIGAGLAHNIKKTTSLSQQREVRACPDSVLSLSKERVEGRGVWTGAAWSALAAVQIAAIVFTLSRGPWVSVAVALVAWLALVLLFAGRRVFFRGAVMLSASLAIAAVTIFLPVRLGGGESGISTKASADAVKQVTSRTANITTSISGGGGLSGRISIWKRSAQVIAERPWFDPEPQLLKPVRYLVGYGPEMLLYALPLRWDPDSHDAVNASAHSYPLQLLVELGLLGLVAYGSLVAALLLGGGLYLVRRRATLRATDKLLYAALLAALAGRVAEQTLGVARVSDTTLFWLLAAALTAMLSISSRDSESSHVQERTVTANGSVWRWAAALAIIAVTLPLVWQKNVPYVQAASLGSDAITAFQQGEPLTGLELMDSSIATAPDVETYYSIQAEMLNAIAADPSAETEIAQKQYALNSAALEANPLSHSAKASLAASALKLAQMGDEAKGAEAIRVYQELIQMLPGYEPVHNDMATAYLILGQPAQALATLDAYADFTGGRKTLSAVSHYLRGVAYQDLGRTEEAITSLETFIEANPKTEPGASYIAPAHHRLTVLRD